MPGPNLHQSHSGQKPSGVLTVLDRGEKTGEAVGTTRADLWVVQRARAARQVGHIGLRCWVTWQSDYPFGEGTAYSCRFRLQKIRFGIDTTVVAVVDLGTDQTPKSNQPHVALVEEGVLLGTAGRTRFAAGRWETVRRNYEVVVADDLFQNQVHSDTQGCP